MSSITQTVLFTDLANYTEAVQDSSRQEIRELIKYHRELVAHTLQIFGGMGLMNDFPIERFWRDARVERIWDGTSEIQRHIISRELLRPLGA